jgi:hypothetical protein
MLNDHLISLLEYQRDIEIIRHHLIEITSIIKIINAHLTPDKVDFIYLKAKLNTLYNLIEDLI